MLSYQEILIRLLLAALLGSVVGLERERLEEVAGLRTHMLVAVGAAIFMLVSAFGFNDILGQPNVVLDPSRVAAQVVSGIGFLGAGTIIMRRTIVHGLTTAASLWAVAAIGLAVGGGLYFAAGTSTVIILVILAGVKPLEEAYRARNQTCFLSIEVEAGALTPDLLRRTLQLRVSQIKRFVVETRSAGNGDNDIVSVLLTKVSSQDMAEFGKKLQELDGVHQVTRLREPPLPR